MEPISAQSAITAVRWLPAISSVDVPPFGLVRVTGSDNAGVYTVAQPNADGQAVWVAGFGGIRGGGTGVVTADFPALAYYDTANAPAVGETWGAANGSWKLTKGKDGFRIAGSPDTTGQIVAVEKATSAAATIASPWKTPVRCATTTNGTISTAYENGDTVDGVTLVTGDRILLKNQSTGAENGIYTVNSSGSPTRSSDAATGDDVYGTTVFVSEGTVNADTYWTCTNNHTSGVPIVVGSTSLIFAQTPSAGLLVNGYVNTTTQSFLGKKTFAGHPTNSNPPSIVLDATTTTAQHTVKDSGANPGKIVQTATGGGASLAILRDPGGGGNQPGFTFSTNTTGGNPFMMTTWESGLTNGGLTLSTVDIYGTGTPVPCYAWSSASGETLFCNNVTGITLRARYFAVYDPGTGTENSGIDGSFDVALNGGGNKVLTFKKGILTSAV